MPMLIQFGAVALVLVSVLSSLFTALADFFIRFFTKKVAMSIAAITLMVGLTGVFLGTLSVLLTSIAFVAPSELSIAWGWFMPSNATACLSAIFGAYTARWVYDTNYNLIFKKGIFGGM